MLADITSNLGRLAIVVISRVGLYSQFIYHSATPIFPPRIKISFIFNQMEFVGNKSLAIILLAGVMVGGIFGFQLGEIFRIFGATSMIGAASGFALCRELAPMVGGFLVTGRAGSAMAAEIGTMKVNEQIDAMRVMTIDPYSYLMSPRIIASTLMMPLLTVFFVISGVLSSFVIGVVFYDVDIADFIAKIQWTISSKDLIAGMKKGAVFGLIFSSIGCFEGFYARGGAKGVGRATTRAVVISYVAIIVADYIISYLQFL